MASPEDAKREFAAKLDRVAKLYKSMPRIAGVQATRYLKDGFKRQGWVENGRVSRWKPRLPGSPRNSRRILSDTGNLKDSIRILSLGVDEVRIGINPSEVPYAEIHNSGGSITITPAMRRYFWAMYYQAVGASTGSGRRRERGRGRGRVSGQAKLWRALALKRSPIKIPKRQFIGYSPDLEKNITRELKRRLDEALKQ